MRVNSSKAGERPGTSRNTHIGKDGLGVEEEASKGKGLLTAADVPRNHRGRYAQLCRPERSHNSPGCAIQGMLGCDGLQSDSARA